MNTDSQTSGIFRAFLSIFQAFKADLGSIAFTQGSILVHSVDGLLLCDQIKLLQTLILLKALADPGQRAPRPNFNGRKQLLPS